MIHPAAALLATVLAACNPADRLLTSPRAVATADDYAVWGAVLDLEVVNTREAGVPVLLYGLTVPHRNDTLTLRFLRPAQRRYGLDGMIAALASADSTPVRIDAHALQRHTRVPIQGVLDELPDPWSGPKRATGEPIRIVTFSPVVFDASRRRALVTVFRSCGARCGSGAQRLMQKDASGVWRQEAVLSGIFS